MSAPANEIVPAPGARRPAAQATSSSWPLPATPATPTISPASNVEIDRAEPHERRAESRATRPRARSSGAPRARTRARSRAGSTALADHAAARARRAGRLAGVVVATTRPARMTVIASATAITSSSLWLMNRIVRPSAFSRRIKRDQSVDLRGREHRGRLVEDQHVGAAIEKAQDLEDLAHVHRRVGDAAAASRSRRRRAAASRSASRSRRAPVDQAAATRSARARGSGFRAASAAAPA